jgi:hypothetical protein
MIEFNLLRERSIVDFRSDLTYWTAFRFPVQNSTTRRELFIGALLMLLPVAGLLLNIGYLVLLFNRMFRGKRDWRLWREYPQLIKHGIKILLSAIYYLIPGLTLYYLASVTGSSLLGYLGVLLMALALFILPACITLYSASFDILDIYNPVAVIKKCHEIGNDYFKAWTITLIALLIACSGLLLFGIGLVITFVWFMHVAAFSFAWVLSDHCAITRRATVFPLVKNA